MKRRQFLAISAASLGAAWMVHRQNQVLEWNGLAFGADVSLRFFGDRAQAEESLVRVQNRIHQIEQSFSLFDPFSEISQLNKYGVLPNPGQDFKQVLSLAEHAFDQTEGQFDPSVQSLWQTGEPRGSFEDFNQAAFSFRKSGMKFTLNGIAQGYATDEISKILNAMNYPKHLVNMGEFRAQQGHYVIGIQNQTGENLGRVGLTNSAIATSEPFAMRTPFNAPHILSNHHQAPKWRVISVKAKSAAMADAFSTGLAFCKENFIAHLVRTNAEIERVWLQDDDGKIKIIS